MNATTALLCISPHLKTATRIREDLNATNCDREAPRETRAMLDEGETKRSSAGSISSCTG